MASQLSRYSRDGNWRIDVEAWKNYFIVYSSIGTQVTVYRQSGRNIWGNTNWEQSAASRIIIRNSYNGGVAVHEGLWENQSHAELKGMAFGAEIKLGSSGLPVPAGGVNTTVDSVEGFVVVVLRSGEAFEVQVKASDALADNSIW